MKETIRKIIEQEYNIKKTVSDLQQQNKELQVPNNLLRQENTVLIEQNAVLRTENKQLKQINTQQNDIITQIGQTQKYEDAKTYLDRQWDAGLFKSTEIKTGTPMEGTVQLLVVGPNKETNNYINLVMNQYPNMLTCDNMAVIEKKVQLEVMIILSKCEACNEDLFERILEVREELGRLGRLKSVVQTMYLKQQHVRKNKARNTYAITVDGQGESFSDILKKVKENINRDNTKCIKNIRSTRDNKLLITLEKDKQKVNNIHNDIKSITGIRTRILEDGKKVSVHIRGMDMECIRDEVREAVPGIGKNLELNGLRPFRGSQQAVTIRGDLILYEFLAH
ncbi:hypothetical protein ABEB36_004747 [Hypothenemus hampei]|uniref:Uncharacterized protein n=1 Tax=Hypothenemus hampei TaxID=57062 RepID=A0ABD1F4B7_HYPHA